MNEQLITQPSFIILEFTLQWQVTLDTPKKVNEQV